MNIPGTVARLFRAVTHYLHLILKYLPYKGYKNFEFLSDQNFSVAKKGPIYLS